MALPAEINSQIEKYTISQDLWNALFSFYERNDQLREEQWDLIQKEYDVFQYKKGEKLCSHIGRFLNVTNRLSKIGINLSEREQIKKLLDSLP
jgi:hypothetical protein